MDDQSNSAVQHSSPSGDAPIEEIGLRTSSRRLLTEIIFSVTLKTAPCSSLRHRSSRNFGSSLDLIDWRDSVHNRLTESVQTRLPSFELYIYRLKGLVRDIYSGPTSVFHQLHNEITKDLVIAMHQLTSQVAPTLNERLAKFSNLALHPENCHLLSLQTALHLLQAGFGPVVLILSVKYLL